jgi:hypothetical protein
MSNKAISFLISMMLMRRRALSTGISTGILLGHYLTMLWGERWKLFDTVERELSFYVT